MKCSRIPMLVIGTALLLGGRPSAAEDWSLAKLNPFGQKAAQKTAQKPAQMTPKKLAAKPSPLDSLQSGTKSFFSKVTGMVTPNKKKERTAKRLHPWLRRPQMHWQQEPPKKASWLDSLLGHEEPEVPQSLADWMSLKRQDP